MALTRILASMVNFIQSGVGAVKRTLQDLMQERVSVLDFLSEAQRADVQAGTALIDCRAGIQACIDYVNSLPAQNRPEVYFPAGRYLINSGLQMYDNISLVGVRRDIGYWYAFSHSSELIAGSAMVSMVNITGSNVYVGHLGLYGNGVAQYGLYTAVPLDQPRKSSATLEYLAVTLCTKTGLHLFNMGLTKATRLQISDCAQCGIDISNSGDSDFTGCYINTINMDSTSTVNAPASATVYGVGIRMRDSSGNINVRGGKIEFTRIGILLNGVDGVNITGVSFDTNRRASIYIDSDNMTAAPTVATENAGTVTSVQISGNRFLGGSPNTQGDTAHIYASNCRYVTISGNGFKRAGDAARDFATDTPQGPVYGVHLANAELCVVAANDLYAAATSNCLRIEHATPANAQHTVRGNSLDSTESIAAGTVRTEAVFSSQVFSSGSNPIAQSTAKAWVKFNGTTNAIIASYNVASVTGGGGTYTVNFSTPMASANYVGLASARNWYGAHDDAIMGACAADSCVVYSTSDGTLSSNGEISVIIFA